MVGPVQADTVGIELVVIADEEVQAFIEDSTVVVDTLVEGDSEDD